MITAKGSHRCFFGHIKLIGNCINTYQLVCRTGGDDSSIRKTRSKIEEGTNASWNWEEVLKQNPEAIGRSSQENELQEAEQRAREEKFNAKQLETLSNPTWAMLKLMASLTDLETQRKEMVKQDQLVEFNKQRKAELAAKFANMELAPAADTPVMEQADTYTLILRRVSILKKTDKEKRNPIFTT